VTLPSDLQLSATPLSGKFKIKCVSPEGYVSYTNPINAGYSDMSGLSEKIHKECNMMGIVDTVKVFNPNDYAYWQNGFSYQLYFRGYQGDPG
jgi:LEA14-like dessication related protein